VSQINWHFRRKKRDSSNILVHRKNISSTIGLIIATNENCREVIGPLPQIAPNKQWVASLWPENFDLVVT
jgi:hypothetical protein